MRRNVQVHLLVLVAVLSGIADLGHYMRGSNSFQSMPHYQLQQSQMEMEVEVEDSLTVTASSASVKTDPRGVVEMLLMMAGDVERNPGPTNFETKFTPKDVRDDLKFRLGPAITIMTLIEEVKAAQEAEKLKLMEPLLKRKRMENSCPSPSVMGKFDSSLCEVNEHRTGGSGLHVSLQVKAFGKFMDMVGGEEEIEPLCYEISGCTLLRMSEYFKTELARVHAFITEMKKIFPPTVCFKAVSENRATSDCTMVINVGNDEFRLANFEIKREFTGISSDPYCRNIGYFIHLQVARAGERAPMLLVSLVGCNYFQVFGAVWNEGRVCIDPLCSPASLLFVPCDPLFGVTKFARILSALKETIRELTVYYESTKVTRKIDNKGPYFHEFKNGTLQYGENIGVPWLYEAKLQSCGAIVEVVVKFVRAHYGKEVHQCLADNQLAPKLYLCEALDGMLSSWRK